jgi:hypothetical protein
MEDMQKKDILKILELTQENQQILKNMIENEEKIYLFCDKYTSLAQLVHDKEYVKEGWVLDREEEKRKENDLDAYEDVEIDKSEFDFEDHIHSLEACRFYDDTWLSCALETFNI